MPVRVLQGPSIEMPSTYQFLNKLNHCPEVNCEYQQLLQLKIRENDPNRKKHIVSGTKEICIFVCISILFAYVDLPNYDDEKKNIIENNHYGTLCIYLF